MSAFDAVTPAALGEATARRLRRLVELESPSPDEPALRAIAAEVAAALVAAGADVDTVDAPGVGEHVVARIPGLDPDPALRPILVLCHLDTVHPVGSFDPVYREADGRARGPGVYDMKAGVACVLEALARLREAGSGPRRPVIVLATCDEETGSHTSRGLIEELAGGAHAVLVPEPCLPDGGIKTRRKGVGVFRLEIRGEATHAGLAPQEGVNALVELAAQIDALGALADPDAGTSVTVCEAGGGTASNVVPGSAWAVVDVRFTTRSEAERVDRQIRALAPRLPGAAVTVTGGINRLPLERTEAIAALYERARALAAETGHVLGEGLSGGASDGSFTAAMGVPTLDGLGPLGGGAHSDDEHVVLEDLPRRVRLLGRLLETE